MEYDFIVQSQAFLFSLFLGALLWIIYTVLKVIRLMFFKKKSQIIAIDILYMVICAFIIFLYSMLMMNGRVRFYMILGATISFIVLYFTLGKAVCLILTSF